MDTSLHQNFEHLITFLRPSLFAPADPSDRPRLRQGLLIRQSLCAPAVLELLGPLRLHRAATPEAVVLGLARLVGERDQSLAVKDDHGVVRGHEPDIRDARERPDGHEADIALGNLARILRAELVEKELRGVPALREHHAVAGALEAGAAVERAVGILAQATAARAGHR